MSNNNIKDFNPSDVKPGDILVMATSDSRLGRLIAFFSGAEYSHCVIVRKVDNARWHCCRTGHIAVVDVCLPGDPIRSVAITYEKKGFPEREVTVVRLNGMNKQKETEIVEAAETLLDSKVHFGVDSLLQIAVLTILKRPELLEREEVMKKLEEVIESFDKHWVEKPETEGMFCCQVPYQCFNKAGHKLTFKKTTENADTDILDIVDEYLQEHELTEDDDDSPRVSSNRDEDTLLAELWEAVKDEDRAPQKLKWKDLVKNKKFIEVFGRVVILFAEYHKHPLPQKTKKKRFREAIQFLKGKSTNKESFLFPVDYFQANNTEIKGKFKVPVIDTRVPYGMIPKKWDN
jgi:hypothetical protein